MVWITNISNSLDQSVRKSSNNYLEKLTFSRQSSPMSLVWTLKIPIGAIVNGPTVLSDISVDTGHGFWESQPQGLA
jgi:hypothetical protein